MIEFCAHCGGLRKPVRRASWKIGEYAKRRKQMAKSPAMTHVLSKKIVITGLDPIGAKLGLPTYTFVVEVRSISEVRED
jgi:hypothetical protein